jgi:hypothetical protein
LQNSGLGSRIGGLVDTIILNIPLCTDNSS